MERIVRYFVDRHMLVNVITLAVVAVGVWNLMRTRVEGFPTIDLPSFMITAELPGAAARDVEAKVTIPLEEAISEVDGIDHFTTVVTQNRSVTTVDLDDDTPREQILETERELRDAVDGVADFPAEMRDDPSFFRLDPSKQPVLELALAGPADLLPDVAKDLERRIRRLPEIGDVGIVGLPDPEARVFVDPDLARAHGVTLLDVVQTLERRNVSATGGPLETANARRQVVMWGRYEDPSEIGPTILRFDPGEGAVRIADVARVELGREDTGLVSGTNGRAGLSIIPQKKSDGDLIRAQRSIVKLVESTPLPAGVEATIVNDSSYEIRNRLEIIANNGLMGIVLVALIVFLFLAPSAATWVCLGVPLVILGVLVVMPRLDIGINFVSTVAFVVVLGLLVDDAVVIAEKILLKRQDGLSPRDAAIAGTSEVARPVIASAVTTLLAFGPILAIGGFPKRILWQMPAVVCISLGLSLLEAFLILPAHMSMVRGDAQPRPKRRFVLRLEAAYRGLLERSLPRRNRVIAGFAIAWLVIMLGIAPRMQFQFFPQDDARALFVKVKTPIGTPLERTEAVLDAIQAQIPPVMGTDLRGMTARVGHQDIYGIDREYGSAENEGLISVYIDLEHRTATAADWIERIKQTLRVPADCEVVYEAAVDGPPGLEPVRVYVLSNDDAVRREVALDVKRFVEAKGAIDVDIDERPGMRQLDLELDHEKLALRGLDAATVGTTLQAAYFGIVATEIRDVEETIDVRVQFEPSARQSVEGLLDTQVRDAQGRLVALRDVVDPVEIPALAAIRHRDGVRAASVVGSLGPHSPYTSSSLAELMERDLLPQYASRPDVAIEIAGEVVQSRRATGDLGTVFALSVVGIACVIAVMLGSFLEALFVVSVVPFSVAAVVLTFFLHGMHFSMLALIGTIGLAGVVVNASIVMIDAVHQAQQRVASEAPLARTAAMVDALVGRLRPILVTSLSTLGGVFPTAYGLGGYDAVMSPMSLALGWGLALSTIVTLFLVPALYVTANDWARRLDEWRRRRGIAAGRGLAAEGGAAPLASLPRDAA
ncbi:MAG: efflux RND transporter permease subunit [Myxococcota bacterium]